MDYLSCPLHNTRNVLTFLNSKCYDFVLLPVKDEQIVPMDGKTLDKLIEAPEQPTLPSPGALPPLAPVPDSTRCSKFSRLGVSEMIGYKYFDDLRVYKIQIIIEKMKNIGSNVAGKIFPNGTFLTLIGGVSNAGLG